MAVFKGMYEGAQGFIIRACSPGRIEKYCIFPAVRTGKIFGVPFKMTRAFGTKRREIPLNIILTGRAEKISFIV